MQVTIVYTAQLKAELGIAQERIQLAAPCTVPELIHHLSQKHERLFARLVVGDDGQLVSSIIPCLNDKQVGLSNDQQISDGDTLTFLSAISGG